MDIQKGNSFSQEAGNDEITSKKPKIKHCFKNNFSNPNSSLFSSKEIVLQSSDFEIIPPPEKSNSKLLGYSQPALVTLRSRTPKDLQGLMFPQLLVESH